MTDYMNSENFDILDAYLRCAGRIDLFSFESEVASFKEYELIAAKIMEELDGVDEIYASLSSDRKQRQTDYEILIDAVGENAVASYDVRKSLLSQVVSLFETLEIAELALKLAKKENKMGDGVIIAQKQRYDALTRTKIGSIFFKRAVTGKNVPLK